MRALQPPRAARPAAPLRAARQLGRKARLVQHGAVHHHEAAAAARALAVIARASVWRPEPGGPASSTAVSDRASRAPAPGPCRSRSPPRPRGPGRCAPVGPARQRLLRVAQQVHEDLFQPHGFGGHAQIGRDLRQGRRQAGRGSARVATYAQKAHETTLTGFLLDLIAETTLSVVPTVPVAGMALIIGVDRFMSECRSLTNFIGNAVATVVVSRWQGAFDRDAFARALAGAAPAGSAQPVTGLGPAPAGLRLGERSAD